MGVFAWLTARAASTERMAWWIVGSAVAGVLMVAAGRMLPVHVAAPGARMADGSSLGGAVVRVERLWPRRPDKLHILSGNGRVRRGAVLLLEGGEPVRYLRGG